MDNQINNNPISINGSSDETTGENFNITVGTSTTTNFIMQYSKKVESVQFIENEEGNFIEVISCESPLAGTITYTNNYSPGRTMVKERYGVKDGKIQLIKAIHGTENLGYYVVPTIKWKE